MIQDIIVNQVKNLIKKAIIRFAKELDVNPDRVSLWIFYKGDNEPGLKVLVDLKSVKEISFGELATPVEKLMYRGMGFDIAVQTPEWLYKFMGRVSSEKEIDIAIPCYYLRIYQNELIALMFINNKKALFNINADDSVDPLAKYKISIEYILETR
jgi:hypothetical protein